MADGGEVVCCDELVCFDEVGAVKEGLVLSGLVL